jgi:hypothetical protein
MSGSRRDDWREQLKAKRKQAAAQRRAQLANDPRVQAMKQALKERRRAANDAAKERRKRLADERKKQQGERAAAERALHDAELAEHVAPATQPDPDRRRTPDG